MAELRLTTPAPLPKPPLAPLTGHNFETDYNPLRLTSSTTKAVGPVPPVACCPELTQRAFEAFRYHKSHDKFGRPHAAHGRHKPHYTEICTHRQQGNCHNSYWTAGPRQSVWAQLIDVGGLAEGPFCHVLFGINLTGLGSQAFYNALHNWLTSFEGVMHCVIHE